MMETMTLGELLFWNAVLIGVLWAVHKYGAQE